MITKIHTHRHMITMTLITMITVGFVAIFGRDSIDCEAPSTWATASGVQHCAINGGK